MALKKDKEKVLGETFDDERVKSFLDVSPHGDVHPDYYVLEKAYRGMKEENFKTFVEFFVEAGRDINAVNPDGQTFLQVISEHRPSQEYVQTLKAQGAK